MVAPLILSAEECMLVETGYFEEPSFRPFPSNRPEHDGAEIKETNRELHRDTVLERTLPAHWWKRSTVEPVLMLRRETDASLTQIALGRASGGTRGSGRGSRRVTIGSWTQISPVPMADVRQELSPQRRQKLDEVLASFSRPLPPMLVEEIGRALQERVSDYRTLVQELSRPQAWIRPVASVSRRDRAATALSFLTPRWRSLEPLENPAPSRLALRVEKAARATSENDLITDDSAVFAGWERSGRSVNGWWEFRSHGRRMLIKNVNAGAGERDTGADLVYVRTNPATVVLVQYKLAHYDAKGRPHLRVDRRLPSQLERMIRFQKDLPKAATVDDLRLGPGFSFVKILEGVNAHPLADDQLTPGWYLPADYVQAMIDAGVRGPKGGRSLPIDKERALMPGVFSGLVRSAWVGSAGTATKILRHLLDPQTSDLTLVIDEVVEG